MLMYRESSYDIDLFEVPFGLDPSNDLSELPDESLQSLLNKEETADLGVCEFNFPFIIFMFSN